MNDDICPLYMQIQLTTGEWTPVDSEPNLRDKYVVWRLVGRVQSRTDWSYVPLPPKVQRRHTRGAIKLWCSYFKHLLPLFSAMLWPHVNNQWNLQKEEGPRTAKLAQSIDLKMKTVDYFLKSSNLVNGFLLMSCYDVMNSVIITEIKGLFWN